MTTQSPPQNSEADRLRLLFDSGIMSKGRAEYRADLEAALATERRLTVERIKERVNELATVAAPAAKGGTPWVCVSRASVHRVLDEIAGEQP